MTITIKLDLPPAILSPNHTVGTRGGRMAKASAIKKYRTAAKVAVLSIVPGGYKPRWKDCTMQVKWYHKTMRFPDRDNIQASLKSAFDGFTDSGLIADDRDVVHLPVIREKDAANPRVEITIQHTPKTTNENLTD